jgi:condensin-2 complex subunit H2
MNTSIFHASGAALIDLSHVGNVDQIYRQMIGRTKQTVVTPDADREREQINKESAVEERETAPFQEEAMAEVTFDGFGDCEVDFGSPEKEEVSVRENVDRMTRQKANQQTSVFCCLPSKTDPWALMDPHDPSGFPEKPFKKTGKPYRVPPHLTEEQTVTTGRKRKRNIAKKPQPPVEYLWEFCSRTLYSSETSLPKNLMKAPAFVEFQDLFWAEQKQRDRRQKKRKKMLSRLLGDWQEFFPQGRSLDVEENQNTDEVVANDDAVDGGWHVDDWEGGGGEAMSPDGVEEPVEVTEPLHTSQPAITQSYETLVKRHVQLQLVVAQKYAQETDLSRRVRDWEETITPLLSKEEEHDPFDIHKCGEKILWQLEQLEMKDSDANVPLCRLTRDKMPYEVCRVLLASLQLANNENIQISNHSMDDATVRLLSKDMPHGRFDTYRVPSHSDSHAV